MSSSFPMRTLRLVGRFFSFLVQIFGVNKMIGLENAGFREPRSVFDPVNKLEDEWRNVNCECSVDVKEVDLS